LLFTFILQARLLKTLQFVTLNYNQTSHFSSRKVSATNSSWEL